ncbi:MAG: amino acid adenylation domain-containing protein [Gordonia sp. (in: high G+C Gram-positive bacteria)]
MDGSVMASRVVYFPLNDTQRALMRSQDALGDTPLCIAQYTELVGTVDVDRFMRFASTWTTQTRFLQVGFEDVDGEIRGKYDSLLHHSPAYLDLRSERDPWSAAMNLMVTDYSNPSDPRRDRLATAWLIQLADDRFFFYNRIHHLLADGFAGKEFCVDLFATYTAVLAGEALVEKSPPDFGAPALADAQYRQSSRRAADRAYWREALSGLPLPQTLSHSVGPAAAVARHATAELPADTLAAVHGAGASVPVIIAAALAAYLGRASESDDVVVNLPVAARTTAALRRTPLPVSNVVPLRTGVGRRMTVDEAVTATQTAMMGALRHQRYRYEEILADLAEAGEHRPPGARGISAVMLNFMLFERGFACGEASATFHVLTTGPVDDLAINVYPAAKNGGLILDLEANPNRYSQADVDVHHRQLVAMIDAIAHAIQENPELLLRDIPLLGDTPVPGDAALPDEPDSDIRIVDSQGRPVPRGIVGTLHREGLPVTEFGWIDPGTGAVCIHGLIENQLVIKGERVQLEYVERAALQLEYVSGAVAVANATRDGFDLAIVAPQGATVAAGPDVDVVAQVRRHLAALLPTVMWPRRIVIVAELAADRRTVATTIKAALTDSEAEDEDLTPTQRAVVDAISAATDIVDPPLDATVLELGATSLTLMQIAARLGEQLDCTIPLHGLNAATTVREFADVVAGAQSDIAAVAGSAPRTSYTPTRAQQEICLITRIDPTNIAYHLAIEVELDPVVDDAVIRAALRDLATRHDVLRTQFPSEGGEIIARVREPERIALPVTRMMLDENAIRRIVTTPLDPEFDLPWYAAVDDSGDSATKLVLIGHHVAFDAWSILILLRDFAVAAAARLDSRTPQWSAQAPGFAAAIARRDVVGSVDSALAQQYWQKVLEDAPYRTPLPEPGARADRHQRTGPTAGPARYFHRRAERSVRDAAIARAARARATPHAVMRVALAAVISEITGIDDVVIGVPVAGRHTSAELEQVGMFVQTVPLRAVGIRAATVPSALAASAAELADATTFAAAAPSGLPDVILAYETDRPDLTAHPLLRSVRPLTTGQARTTLEVTVIDDGDGFDITLAAAEQRIDTAAAEQILDRFVDTIGILAHAEDTAAVGECTPRVARAPRAVRSDPVEPIDPIAALIAHAHAAPSAPAVVDDGVRIDYAGLLTRAREVADNLRGIGVRPGDRVALRMTRSADTIVAIIGVLLAEAAYVPLDVQYPTARVDLILAETDPAALINDGMSIVAGPGLRRARREPNAAYIIHTSGSTGTPKGVVVTRTNLAAMLGASLAAVAVRAGDVWGWVHSYCFDVSVWEIFGALASGGSVAVVTRRTALDPVELLDQIRAQHISVLCQTPSAFSRLVDPMIDTKHPDDLASLRMVMLGGESIQAPAFGAWSHAHPGVELIAMYGPTETTVNLTVGRLDINDSRTLIGAPIAGIEWAIRDERGQRVPTGARGELYVAGPQLALGYLNRPELTAVRFVADPDGSGARMYRTGDIVRETFDAGIEFLGRTDDQIQLRGYRIELTEVAAALRGVPGVVETRALVATGARPGDERLIAFALRDGFTDVTEQDLHSAATAILPAHAVPSRIGIIDRWPLTDTGKLDQRALLEQLPPTPGPTRPLTASEQIVAAAMRETVGEDVPELAPHSNFFVVGGTSLSAARLAATLSHQGYPIAVTDVFDRPTVEHLAQLLAGTTQPVVGPALTAMGEVPPRTPLTPEQLDLWLRWQAEPGFTGFLMPFALPVPSTAQRAMEALRTLVLRHDVLRMSYPTHDGVPYQRWWNDDEVAAHWAALDSVDPDSTLAPIDLAESLPWRVHVRESDGRTWIVGAVHHIAVDGESAAILRAQLTALLTGDSGRIGDAGIDYRRYTMWRDATLSLRRPELVDHWRATFATPIQALRLPEVNLAAAAARESTRIHRVYSVLDQQATAAVDALALEKQTTAFIAVHTALAAVLAAQSDTSVVTLVTAVSGRTEPELAGVAGQFARAIPLHTPIDRDQTFAKLLAHITKIDLGAIAHSDLPLAEITALADPQHLGAGTPLFEIALGVLPDELAGLAATHDVEAFGAPLFGIDISLFRTDGQMHLAMACSDAVADTQRLDALCRLVVDVLERGAAEPDRVVDDLLAMSGAMTPAQAHVPPVETLAALLDARLRVQPDALAIIDGQHHFPGYGSGLTNGDVDRLSAALARQLIDRGIGPGDVVVAHLPRSVFGIVASLAIARSGAAFVNVDPADPETRRLGIIERSHPVAVLTLSSHRLPGGLSAAAGSALHIIELDGVQPDGRELNGTARSGANEAVFDPAERVRPLDPDHVAYITFTSGTTGTPKGVEVTHRGLSGWARDTAARLQLTENDRILHTYATGFDAHLMGLVPPMVTGATIVICPPEVIAGDELREVVIEHRVTMLFSTPSILATLHPAELPGVRHVAVGGEPLGPGMIRDWVGGPSDRSLSNEYGPTEGTVAVSSARFTAGWTGSVVIGTALSGVRMHVLDERLRPVPAYTVGELYLSGNCVAQGYLNAPAATAAAFVADIAGSGGRMYRTGDLVHRRVDGTLVIHGRTDDQVKVRGVRLEPAEIDAALSRLDNISTSVTAVRTTAVGEKVLVAWVVPEPGVTMVPERVRRELEHVLPRSIIPGIVVPIAELPLGTTGKADFTRLPEPDLAGLAAADVESGIELEGVSQHLVAGVLAQVLEVSVDSLYADTDFFSVGGTSLSATQVTSRLSAAVGVDIGVRVLFDARTIAGVATWLDEAVADQRDDTPAIPAPRPAPDGLMLSYPQRRMWIHHQYDPMSTAYHVPLVIRLDGDVDIATLRSAINMVVTAHPVLRTVYRDTPSGPVQKILPAAEGPVLEISDIAGSDVESAVGRYVSAPFDLASQPGFRVALLRVAPDADGDRRSAVLAAVLHHIAVDGWSMRILFGDVLRALSGEVIESGHTYADYTLWQHEWLGDPDTPGSRYSRELDYWTTALAGAAPIRLPLDRVGELPGRAARVSRTVDGTVVTRLRELANRHSATVFHVAHAALVATFGQLTGTWDTVIGVPVHGRSAPEWESVVGMFVNTVALRTRTAPDTEVGAVVDAVREAALAASANSGVPYESVARAVAPDDRSGSDPLISVLLVNQDVLPTISGDLGLGEISGAQAAVVASPGTAIDAKYDLEVLISDDATSELAVTLVYSQRLSAERAETLLDEYLGMLRAAAQDEYRPFPALHRGVVDDTSALADADAAAVADVAPVDADAPGRVAAAGITAMVIEAMAEVLGVSVSAADDFFMIGGTSLSATRMASEVSRRIDVRIPTRLVFENPTAAGLAAAIEIAVEENSSVGEAGATTAAGAGSRVGELPLAPTQRRMWLSAQLLSEVPIYAVPTLVPIPAGVARQRVLDAIRTVVVRHPALRTRYRATPDGPRQEILGHWQPEIRDTVRPEDLAEPFDLTVEPPVRVWILGDADTPTAVMILAHHIAFDGESAAIVYNELTALFAGAALDALPIGFDVLTRRLVAEELATHDGQLNFWAHALDGYSGVLDLVPARPAVRDLRTSTADFSLGAELSESVIAAARRHRASTFHILHAATALALGAQAGTDDVAVATPTSLRRDLESAGTVGMLVCTVVLRSRIDPDRTVADFLEQVRDADLAAVDNALIAFEDVVALVDPPREPGRHPLVQIAFSTSSATPVESLLGSETHGEGFLDSRSEFDLHVVMAEQDGEFRLQLNYAADLFDADFIGRIADRILAAAKIVVSDADRRLASVSLLADDEREFVDDRATGGQSTPNHAVLLSDLLMSAIVNHPTRIALDDGTRALTYREFDWWVSETARALRSGGLGAGDVIAVAIGRSIESVIALWAVTRIGGVCVPVDLTYPTARIERMIEATGAVVLDSIPDQPTTPVESEPISRVSRDSLAYIITTSGSTGTPNVVGVPHRGIHRVAGLGDVVADDRVGMAFSPGFDATFHDILLPLSAGATLVVIPADIIGGRELAQWLRAQRVSVVGMTPSVAGTLDPAALDSLRLVYFGGEALSVDLVDEWSDHTSVCNIYGPTETTVTVARAHTRPGEQIRIGVPRPGIGAVLLDCALRPVPPGVTGELYVGGTGLARGYLADPGLTASRFVAGPGGERLYRTGDLMRWDTDSGELVYVGRGDRQLKIRGQRVEPAEIDAVLRRAGATQAATVLRAGPAGETLVSYVVSDTSVADLDAACRTLLPRHMVPGRIVALAELPLSGAGKLDGKRLPEPTWAQVLRAPQTMTERAVVAAFTAVLGIPVGLDDDFFATGGNSLALLSLRDEIHARTGVAVPADQLFAHPTPGEIAGLVDSPHGVQQARIVELSAPDSGEKPLLWCVHTAAGVAEPFRPLAAALRTLRVVGLQLPELIDPTLQMPDSLGEIAALHVRAMRTVQPEGPYRLVGWSLGGAIAQEIARQLVAAGAAVELLVLLDARTPTELRDAPDDELRLDSELRTQALDRYPELVALFDARTVVLADSVRSYRLAPVPIGKVLYIAATDNPDPQAWAREVGGVPETGGAVEIVLLDAAHGELGDPEIMRQIARKVEEQR